MEQLLGLVVLGAATLAFLARHSIPRRAARRITVGSLVGLLASGLGLGLLLHAGVSPLHPYLWGWLLMGLLLVSLCAAPFGLAPLLARRRTDGGVDSAA